jgi:hypothetical protein
MKPAHFYHLYCGGDWRRIASEHVAALSEAGFDGPCVVTVLGPDRHEGFWWCMENWPDAVLFPYQGDGFEQVTLGFLRDWARVQPEDRPVLYAHDKGSFHPSEQNDLWRREMTSGLLDEWQLNVEILQDSDAVGLHWLTPEEFGWEGIISPFFGGNFWWANAGYLASLPAPQEATRFQAEAWIGLGDPQVVDLAPGWPPYAPPDFGPFGSSPDPY